MARGVDEGDETPVFLRLVGADVLRDAARFAGHDVGLADAVEQEGLAVVDVAHDGDHGRTGPEVVGLLVVVGQHGLELDLLLLTRVDEQDLGADVVGEQLDHLVGQ